jgi:predicted lysophospholipase L1 biosynthesis ABC-type transport system permease subunit
MQATRGGFHTWVMLLCLAVLCLAAMPARAQYSSGIEATIVDQNGAVIPSAQVMLTNQETHVQQTAVANGQGLVQITHLPSGRY